MYYRLYTQEKRIPGLFAILAIALILLGLHTASRRVGVRSLRVDVVGLSRVEATNITHNAASICWQTDKKAGGSVLFGTDEEKLVQESIDERDVADDKKSRYLHCASLKDLIPNTRYHYQIVIDGKSVDKRFSFVTTPAFGRVPKLLPALCKVQTEEGTPVQDGVVFVRIKDANPLSGFIKPTGECLVPLHYVTKVGSNELLERPEEARATVEIIDAQGSFSQIDTTVSRLSSLPLVVIGQNYVVDDEKPSALGERQSQAERKEHSVTILLPEEDSSIAGSKPLFKGTALPKRNIRITIESGEPTFYTVVADQEGVWKFVPTRSLSPGKHTITLTTKDKNGNEITLTRNFTILKSGEGVLGEATPEATITQAPEEPTQAPTLTPTTPTGSKGGTTTPTPPVSGFNIMPFAVASLSLVLLGIGTLLLF